MSDKKTIREFFFKDEILGEVAKNNPLPDLNIYGKKGTYLALVEAIISQQLSPFAATKIYERFERKIKSKNLPRYVSKLKVEDLREIGISTSKCNCIIELSKKVTSEELDLNEIKKLSNEEIIFELTKIKGIGLWTSYMFLIFGLKREDIWPFNDYGIRKKLSILLKRNEILSFDETKKFGNRWTPYRSYASCYIWGI